MKIGIGRDVAKGVVLMRKGFFDFEGSEHTATSPSGTPFSKAFSNMKDLFGAPFCSSKASDMVLIKWLHWFVSLNILNSIGDGTTLGLNKTYSHGPWVLFFPELHAASSWLRSFGTEVHYGEDQGFNHEAQAPRIAPLGLKTLLWQACQGGLFRLYRALLVDLRVMQCFFLKINPSIGKEINKQEGPPEWGSNGKSKSDATMKNDSR